MGQTADGYVETASLSATHWLALGLVLVTGVIHVFAGLVEGRIPVLLAGVGFLGAAGLFLMDFRRTLLYLVGIVFTGIQIPLWYVAKAGEYTPVGYADKAIQVALIIVLAYLYWQQRQAPDRRTDATAA
jgi:hypothetical protein